MRKYFFLFALVLLINNTICIESTFLPTDAENKYLSDYENEVLEFEETLKEPNLSALQDSLRLINSTLSKNDEFKHKAWEKTAYLVDTFGPRLWGSQALEDMVQETLKMMETDGFENYYTQECKDSPQWIRGEESLTLYSPRPFPTNIPMIGLGWSVGGTVKAELIVVKDFDELKKVNAKGKIVLFNSIWKSYGETVAYRSRGAIEAAKQGAIGSLVRSIAPETWATPHTGFVGYSDSVPKIPAAAISLEDADMFQRMQDRGQIIIVELKMEAKFGNPVTTHNIIAELKGTEQPDEILLMGGHIDSWDVGPQTGASDDLAGFIMCYEAMRLLKNLNLRPKRTIRLIGWSGEEQGNEKNGANVYYQQAVLKGELNKHIVAFESDLGADNISGFGFDGSTRANVYMKSIVGLFKEFGMGDLYLGLGENADVSPLYENNIPTLNNYVRQTPNADEYFLIHHTAADTMNILNPDYMDRNVMGIAGIMYAIANLSVDLPKNDSN